MPVDLDGLARALEASALGDWMRGGWAYPLANVLHLFGLVMLLGAISLLDLRLLGMGRSLAASTASRLLTPVAVAGLCLLLPTGILLFAADAGALLHNRLMQWKLLAITLALVNALWFRLRHSRHLAEWDRAAPLSGKVSAALSLLLWPSILVAGRMIAYV